eukprot:49516-Karenia_brevis.AAC.1
MPIQLLEPLQRVMERPTIFEELVTDAHLLQVITQAFSDTWFTINDSQNIAVARSGTQPGRQLADLVFNISVVPVLEDVATKMASCNLS